MKPKRQRNQEYRTKNRARLNAASKERYALKKDEINEKAKARYQKNKPAVLKKTREAAMMRLYGITPEDRLQLYLKQKGLCALCNRRLPSEDHRDAVIDHDHKTKRVRGILHRACNTALGLFEDDLQLIQKAATYLMRDQP